MAGIKPWLARYWLACGIVLAFLLLWGILWSARETRVAIKTGIMAPDLFADFPTSPLRLTAVEPIREEVRIDAPRGRGHVLAHVYRPRDRRSHGAILLAVGAAPRIREHPGVVRVSKAVARAGAVVMVPQLYYPFPENALPEDVNGLLDAFGSNIEELIASFQWLQERDYVDAERVGILGASAGGGIGMIAAADPAINEEIAFVATLGAYYDLVDLVNAMATHSVRYAGRTIPWEPAVKNARILPRSLIAFLPDENDRTILTRLFLEDDKMASDETQGLTAMGLEAYRALDSRDADGILSLWTRLSPLDVSSLRRISPSSYLEQLEAELYIFTDQSDPYVPYVESRRLHDAALDSGKSVHYAEFDFLDHVELAGPSNPFLFIVDLVKLFFYSWLLALHVL